MIDKAKEIIAATSQKMADAVEFLDEDLKTYRAGKANPTVFNTVMVNYYGSMTRYPKLPASTLLMPRHLSFSLGRKT